MDAVHHALEIDLDIVEAELIIAISARSAAVDVRRVRVVACRAYFGIAAAVIAVQRQVLVAVVAVVDVDDIAPALRIRIAEFIHIGDREWQ